MSFSIRLNPEEKNLAESYAKLHAMSVGEAFKSALFEKIEDFYSFSTEQLFAQKKPKALVSCAPVSPSRGPFEGKFVKMGLIEAVRASKSVKSKLMEHVPLPIKYYGLKLLAKVRSFRDRG